MAEDKSFSTLGWFVAGVGIGAVIGILFAPKSGSETRESIVSGAREGGEYIRNKAHEASEQISGLYQRGKTQAAGLHERGKEQWSDLVDRSREYVADKATRVSAAVDAGREAYYSSAHSENEPGV
jgi:gas vesicle protein